MRCVERAHSAISSLVSPRLLQTESAFTFDLPSHTHTQRPNVNGFARSSRMPSHTDCIFFNGGEPSGGLLAVALASCAFFTAAAMVFVLAVLLTLW